MRGRRAPTWVRVENWGVGVATKSTKIPENSLQASPSTGAWQTGMMGSLAMVLVAALHLPPAAASHVRPAFDHSSDKISTNGFPGHMAGKIEEPVGTNPATPACTYDAHQATIGPRAEQAKKDEHVCRSPATCVAEASAACSAATNCSSFALNPAWLHGVAQLYSTHWGAAYSDPGWTLYACAGDTPPSPGPPSPPPRPPPPPLPPPIAPVGKCRTDIDCSLNGVCDRSTGACACDAPWKNGVSGREACNVLDVLPHPDDYVPAYGGPRTDTAYGHQNTTSWGGNILLGEDGKYHMWVSAMGDGQGLSKWGQVSQIDHGVAADPMGVFHKRDTALDREVRCIRGGFSLLLLFCTCSPPLLSPNGAAPGAHSKDAVAGVAEFARTGDGHVHRQGATFARAEPQQYQQRNHPPLPPPAPPRRRRCRCLEQQPYLSPRCRGP